MNNQFAQGGGGRRLSGSWFTWGNDARSSNSDSVCSTIRSYLPSACSMPTCGTSSRISCSVSDDLDGWLSTPLALSASANLQLCASPASGGIDISGFGTSWSKQFSAEDTVSEPIP